MSWIAPARRTMTAANARQRGFRLLAVVGATAVMTMVSQPAAATQPEPPAESDPIEVATTTTSAPPATTSAPTSTAASTTEVPSTEASTTTTTTTVSPTLIAPPVVYSANAECDPETGQTTVSWQLINNGLTPVQIITTSAEVPLEPNPVPALGSASATMTLDGPDTDQQVATTVTIDDGSGGQIELSEDVTAAACEGPEAPPDVTFTFVSTPSQSRAVVGDIVEYEYCGTNTSTIPLEVVRLVDDRLGVMIELPSVQTVVGPGESICNTDIGNIASYTVQPDDSGSVIHNNAVVTVRTQEDEPREFQGTATSAVAVDLLRGLTGRGTGHPNLSPHELWHRAQSVRPPEPQPVQPAEPQRVQPDPRRPR